MKLENLERLIKAHAALMDSLKPVMRGDGEVHYNFSSTKDAVDAVAQQIKAEANSP